MVDGRRALPRHAARLPRAHRARRRRLAHGAPPPAAPHRQPHLEERAQPRARRAPHPRAARRASDPPGRPARGRRGRRRRRAPRGPITLYEVLGVSRTATDDEIRRAYKRQREIFREGGLAVVSRRSTRRRAPQGAGPHRGGATTRCSIRCAAAPTTSRPSPTTPASRWRRRAPRSASAAELAHAPGRAGARDQRGDPVLGRAPPQGARVARASSSATSPSGPRSRSPTSPPSRTSRAGDLPARGLRAGLRADGGEVPQARPGAGRARRTCAGCARARRRRSASVRRAIGVRRSEPRGERRAGGPRPRLHGGRSSSRRSSRGSTSPSPGRASRSGTGTTTTSAPSASPRGSATPTTWSIGGHPCGTRGATTRSATAASSASSTASSARARTSPPSPTPSPARSSARSSTASPATPRPRSARASRPSSRPLSPGPRRLLRPADDRAPRRARRRRPRRGSSRATSASSAARSPAGVVLGLTALVRPQSLLCAPALALLVRPAPRGAWTGRALAAAAPDRARARRRARRRGPVDRAQLPRHGRLRPRLHQRGVEPRHRRLPARHRPLRDPARHRRLPRRDRARCSRTAAGWTRACAGSPSAPRRWLGLMPDKLAFTFDHESFPMGYLGEADPADVARGAQGRGPRPALRPSHRALLALAALGVVAWPFARGHAPRRPRSCRALAARCGLWLGGAGPLGRHAPGVAARGAPARSWRRCRCRGGRGTAGWSGTWRGRWRRWRSRTRCSSGRIGITWC